MQDGAGWVLPPSPGAAIGEVLGALHTGLALSCIQVDRCGEVWEMIGGRMWRVVTLGVLGVGGWSVNICGSFGGRK